MGNFLSRKLLLPLDHPGATGVKDLEAISESRLFLQQMGNECERLGTRSNNGYINPMVHK